MKAQLPTCKGQDTYVMQPTLNAMIHVEHCSNHPSVSRQSMTTYASWEKGWALEPLLQQGHLWQCCLPSLCTV